MPVYIDVSAAVHQRAGLARYASRIASTMISEHHGAFSFALFHNGADSCGRLAGLGPVPRSSVPLGSKPWRMMVWLSHLAGVGLDRLVPGVELFHSTEHLLMPLQSAPTVMTGASEYPPPGSVTVIPVTIPLLTTATAFAAGPKSGGATVTAGAVK